MLATCACGKAFQMQIRVSERSWSARQILIEVFRSLKTEIQRQGDGDFMTFQNIILKQEEAVYTIVFNRPKVLNALDRQTVEELASAIVIVEKDSSARALVLTGAGEKSFIAGADIAAMQSLNSVEARDFASYGHRVLDSLSRLPIPVIAAVNGFALGGGLETALACDFIYASENAKLGLVEVNLGLIPGFGGVARLARRVGTAKASEMIFSAAILNSAEALQCGLITKVTTQQELLDAAYKTAKSIASKGPQAVALCKRLLVEGQDADWRVANSFEQVAFGQVFATKDHDEGIAAFWKSGRRNLKISNQNLIYRLC
jgi:enoyl-CoA hydratase